jgi:RES domain-containing protein
MESAAPLQAAAGTRAANESSISGPCAGIVVLERLAHTDPDIRGVDGLSSDWIQDQSATRALGRRWRQESSSSLLLVPSAVLPEESNYVFHPQHSDSNLIR